MTTSSRVAMTRTDVSAAIVLLLIAEATFFFTAGPFGEQHGLFGKVVTSTVPD